MTALRKIVILNNSVFSCRRSLSKMIQGSKWLPTESDESLNGKAYVRCIDEDERLRISLKFIRPANNSVKFFNFERLKSELLSVTIQRMTNNIQKEISPATSKKGKKAAAKKKQANDGKENGTSPEPVEGPGEICLFKDGKAIDASKTTNVEAWMAADELRIGETVYSLVVNYPTIILLQVCDSPLANYYCPVKCHSEFADNLECCYEWFVSFPNGNSKAEARASADLVGVLHKNWVKVAEGFPYIPSENDLGKHVLLKCTPLRKENDGSTVIGESVLSQSQNVISTGPKECPFEKRQKLHLAKYGSEEERNRILRVLTYNVLADVYTDMPETGNNLFPYCPQKFLDHKYRKLLLMKEIQGYDADLICLQEVDNHVFNNDYRPFLHSCGYDGQLTLKGRTVKEGVALFYRRDRFDVVEVCDYFVGGCLESDPDFAELHERMLKVPHVYETFTTRSTVLQFVHMIDKFNGRRLLVANTHFYFHWTADNIRLLQGYVCARVLSRKKAEIKTATGEEPLVLFSGDFNSDFRCGVYRLYTKGQVPGNFSEFFQGGIQNFIPDLGDMIKTDLRFFSATGVPIYTTVVAGFSGTLDYVYAELDHFEVASTLPIYDDDEFLPYSALPNEVFPSDHMAMVTDLKYKNSEAKEM